MGITIKICNAALFLIKSDEFSNKQADVPPQESLLVILTIGKLQRAASKVLTCAEY